jgi:hypothetical protein
VRQNGEKLVLQPARFVGYDTKASLLGDVPRDLRRPDDLSLGRPDRRDRDGYVDERAVFPLTDGRILASTSSSSDCRSAGMIMRIDWPTASAGVYPKIRSAPRFQVRMIPFRSLLTMASSEEATMAASLDSMSCRCAIRGDFKPECQARDTTDRRLS